MSVLVAYRPFVARRDTEQAVERQKGLSRRVHSGANSDRSSTSDPSSRSAPLVVTQISASRRPRPSNSDRACESRRHRTRVYADKTIPCRDCGMDFVFSAGEQEFYASKGLVNEPQRCQSCRAIAKQNRALGIGGGGNGNGNGGEREMHAAVCAECGGQALVPFLPRNDRPVYCSNCFDKVRARA